MPRRVEEVRFRMERVLLGVSSEKREGERRGEGGC